MMVYGSIPNIFVYGLWSLLLEVFLATEAVVHQMPQLFCCLWEKKEAITKLYNYQQTHPGPVLHEHRYSNAIRNSEK